MNEDFVNFRPHSSDMGERLNLNDVHVIDVSIANNESLSSAIDLRGYSKIWLHMADDWDAASLTFQAAPTLDGTYQDVYNAGTEVEATVAADRVYNLSSLIGGLRFIKIRSGTGGSPVNQTPARTLKLILMA